MAEPEEIRAFCEALLEKREQLRGVRVLVTAGGTREPLDDVRFISAPPGRMGVALAEEARRRGADVTLVASNLTVARPAGVEVVDAPTAADLEREVLARADADLVLMAAAVADYRPLISVAGKRGKDASTWTVELRAHHGRAPEARRGTAAASSSGSRPSPVRTRSSARGAS